MIKSLRIKFVLINMTIITVMLYSILGLIWFFTKQNLENESIGMMKSVAIEPFALGQPDSADDNVRLPYFVLRLGPMGEFVTAHSGYYDLNNDEFLNEITKSVLSSPRHLGTLPEYNLRYYRLDNPLSPCIVFADMSSEKATLHSLLITCIVIGTVGFAVFLGLSILLSHRVTAPVEEAFKKQRQFIADASHELKTPLTVVLTNTELMQNGVSDDGHLLEATHAMSLRMKKLISQMLELAKTEYDYVPAQSDRMNENVDLSDTVSESALTFETVFFEKGLTLDTQAEENIFVTGNRQMFTELIDILLDNACKYSKNGGTTWLTLKRSDKNHCLLRVANEGAPIDACDLKNLFTRFYRADHTGGSVSGSGLGLSIASNIVKLHHGKIKAESLDGVNSFTVRLECRTTPSK